MNATADKFLKLSVTGVQGLKPYVPGKPLSELEREYGISDSIKLASNENPLGPSKKVLEAIRSELDELALYPDSNGFELKRILAERHGVSADNITLGNGSNDVLEVLARVFLTTGRSAVFSKYAFVVYPIVTQATGAASYIADANPIDHEMPYGHDLNAMLGLIDGTTRIVFIANPNNPTGTWVAKDELINFIENVSDDVLVVVDEAYSEYVQETAYPDMSRYLDKYENLVVTRTFSKAYGLAGIRVGYALTNAAVADLMNRIRQPFNVNSIALAAAVAALNDAEHLTASVRVNSEGLQQLTDAFTDLGLNYIPSIGNFVTVDMNQPALPVYEALLREGIIVRPVANYGLPNHLRISIGLREQNQRLIATLRRILAA